MTDQWDAPLAPGACPWCSAANAPDARQCVSCGAAIAQRDDLGGVVVPGVTGVDPNLLGTPSSLASPMLRGQGTLGALNAVSQVNATLGLAAAAAYLGQDALKGMLGANDADLETVGVPSEAALLAAEKLERERVEAEAVAADVGAAPSGAGPTAEPTVKSGPAIDPWADLPVAAPAEPAEPAAPAIDPWADLPVAEPAAPAPPAIDPWADLPVAEPAAPAIDPWADLPDRGASGS